MDKKRNLFLRLAFLLSLLLSGYTQPILAQNSGNIDLSLGTTPGKLIVGSVLSAVPPETAYFTFTSDTNPSYFGQKVTFTVSATGTHSMYQPFGYVDFYDNGELIDNCENIPLNLSSESMPESGIPASCVTSFLGVGSHTITAEFDSLWDEHYADDNNLTLSEVQIVNEPITLTIAPDTLSDAMISVYTRFYLVAYYPGGSNCENCIWRTTNGDLPDGIGLNSSTGEMMGTPSTIGTYNFTVQVDDENGAQGSQGYTWNVTKVKTIVKVSNPTTTVGTTEPITLGAEAQHPDPYYATRPTGKISFSVNGVPVSGCSGTEAISTNDWGSAYCTSYLPTDLTTGSYQIKAEFTPDESSSAQYLGGSGVGTLQVKVKPNMSLFISTPTFYGHKFNIRVNARTESGTPIPGTVDFSIDDEPVAACQNVPLDPTNEYFCQDVSLLLAVGGHTLSAEFTPTDTTTYSDVDDSISFTIEPGSYLISGFVFDDTNQDGERDSNEFDLSGWTIKLTTCDGDPVLDTNGNVIGPQVTSYFGYFTFSNVPGGQCIHLTEEMQTGWQATTPIQLEFTLSKDVHFVKFGNFYPYITVNLEGDPLPNGKVGEAYGPRTFTASGGEGPYTFTIKDGDLPDGLELSTDGVLSGSPTMAGDFFFTVQAEDQDQATGNMYYMISVKEDITFTVFLPLVGKK